MPRYEKFTATLEVKIPFTAGSKPATERSVKSAVKAALDSADIKFGELVVLQK